MRPIKRNSAAEEAAIQHGIASDPDAAEWTVNDFIQARRATEAYGGKHDTTQSRFLNQSGKNAMDYIALSTLGRNRV